MNRAQLINLLLSGFIILILVGCTPEETPSPTAEPPEAAPLSTSRPTDIPETPSPLPPDPTPSVTVAPATATTEPVTATPGITAVTLTPLPTLEGEALEIAVAELLANPMNCDVPCWWGAIPGVSNISEVKHAISPYNFDIHEYDYEDDGKQIMGLRVGIGWIEARSDFEVRIGYGFSNSILIDISGYAPTIPEILTRYGQPDEIWLSTIGFSPPGSLPVRLNMVYFDEGMAVGYVVDGDIQNDMVIGCYADNETGNLQLNVPGSSTGYSDFPGVFELGRPYKTLESATNLTMEDFMELFSDPTQPHCIETPTELWE